MGQESLLSRYTVMGAVVFGAAVLYQFIFLIILLQGFPTIKEDLKHTYLSAPLGGDNENISDEELFRWNMRMALVLTLPGIVGYGFYFVNPKMSLISAPLASVVKSLIWFMCCFWYYPKAAGYEINQGLMLLEGIDCIFIFGVCCPWGRVNLTDETTTSMV